MARLPKPKSYRELKQKDREVMESEDAWKQDRVERGLSEKESMGQRLGVSDGRKEARNKSRPSSTNQLSRTSSSAQRDSGVQNSNNNSEMEEEYDDAPPIPPPDYEKE